MSNTSVAAIPGKVTARIATVHIDPACNAFLGDCFRQFGISVVPLEGDPVAVFQRQKFEACVVRLYDPEADKILKAARASASNRRMVIYGIARNTQEALRYVRVPVISQAEVDIGSRNNIPVTTVEISSGGMSVRSDIQLPKSDAFRLLLDLPGLEKLSVRASVCWHRENEKVYGLRFDATDDRRLRVRSWIDQYLEIV
jgi:hypothetical protein